MSGLDVRPPVVIVGGGISGLSAAYELDQRGVPFLLFERSGSLGGVIRTEHVGGYTIDAGPDALLTQKPAALELCRALGIAHRLQPQAARASFVLRAGKLRPLPEASVFGVPTRWLPFITSDALSWPARLRMAADLWIGASSGGDESIASFIGRRFGADAVEYMAEPLLAGIHGGDPERLSMRCAFPRLLALEARYGSVIRGLQREAFANRSDKKSGASRFVSLPHGMAELVDALRSRLSSNAIRQGAAVAEVRNEHGALSVRTADGERTAASAIVLATPPPATAALTRRLDARLSEYCARIRMASSVAIALGYRRSAVTHALNGTGFVTPRSEGCAVHAVSWVSSKWRDRAPAGAVLLRAYMGGMLKPDVIDVDDDTLIAFAARDCATVLGIRADPELTRVFRWRDATPQLEVGHLELMEHIETSLRAQPGMFISASGFRGTGIADCVADARRQAARAAEFVGDRWREPSRQPIAV